MTMWLQNTMHNSAAKPHILPLGSYHMANPNRDYANVQADDVLAERRQQDIRACVDRLLLYRPSKVAVEITADREEELNREYHEFRGGRFTLPASEVYQLGFRIAAESGHDRLYGINWWNRYSGPDPIEYARSHGQAALVDALLASADRAVAETNARLQGGSIAEALRFINEPERLRRDHAVYLGLARIGHGAETPGADWVANWFERNLHMFVNLTEITNSPRDRILLLVGAGHIPLLTQFVRDSGEYVLESPEDYLG